MSDESRRALYRVVYPLAERPTLQIGRHLYEVVDCSEQGLRVEMRGGRHPIVGTQIEGILQFRRGDEVEIFGTVFRVFAGAVVLSLDPPLPFAEVLAEQRYLRSKGYSLKE
jgi:hypothetical protein